jgi:hypothetical protein
LCIGQAPAAQHAIRASAVGSHPAQTAELPLSKPKHKRTADRRWTRTTTSRMLDWCRPCQTRQASRRPSAARRPDWLVGSEVLRSCRSTTNNQIAAVKATNVTAPTR